MPVGAVEARPRLQGAEGETGRVRETPLCEDERAPWLRSSIPGCSRPSTKVIPRAVAGCSRKRWQRMWADSACQPQ